MAADRRGDRCRLFGLVTGVPSMAIPGTIVGGIGGILLWQSATGHWSSWAYMWTLIPGFVGLGIVLTGFLGGENLQSAVRSGLGLITTSLALFAIFGTFFGALIFKEPFWPLLLIGLGVVLVALAWGGGRGTRTPKAF